MKRYLLSLILLIAVTGAWSNDPRQGHIHIAPPGDIAMCAVPEANHATGPGGYLTHLFSTSNYPARWNCGYWSDFDGWFIIISDLSIFLAYLSIPLILIFILLKKKKEVPFKKGLILFAMFILFCGFTHLIEVVLFWEPFYRFSGLVKFFTGVISWVTVLYLAQVLPITLTYRSPSDMEEEIAQRKRVEQDLTQINEELAAFTYSVSHDLRAPLRAINGYSIALRDDFSKELGESGLNHLGRILNNANKMGVLIDDLLKYSRLNRTSIHFGEFPAHAVIQNVLDLDPEFQQVQVRAESLPVMYGDKMMMQQVFQNLISNAVKYSRHAKPPRIEIYGAEDEKEVYVTVKDNGAGFDMKYAHKLFEVFQRLHAESEFEGSGVGLAICKKIIDKHYGKIAFESKVNKGSKFTVILPKPN